MHGSVLVPCLHSVPRWPTARASALLMALLGDSESEVGSELIVTTVLGEITTPETTGLVEPSEAFGPAVIDDAPVLDEVLDGERMANNPTIKITGATEGTGMVDGLAELHVCTDAICSNGETTVLETVDHPDFILNVLQVLIGDRGIPVLIFQSDAPPAIEIASLISDLDLAVG